MVLGADESDESFSPRAHVGKWNHLSGQTAVKLYIRLTAETDLVLRVHKYTKLTQEQDGWAAQYKPPSLTASCEQQQSGHDPYFILNFHLSNLSSQVNVTMPRTNEIVTKETYPAYMAHPGFNAYYFDNASMHKECAVMAIISFCLTLVNIISIIVAGSLFLKVCLQTFDNCSRAKLRRVT